jgi:hypothetical protein
MAQTEATVQPSLLKAEYQGHTDETKELEHPIGPLATNHSVKDKAEYLAKLRASVVKMQDEINTFLTAKMEEDNKNTGSKAAPAEDTKEEENYGEEIVDDE